MSDSDKRNSPKKPKKNKRRLVTWDKLPADALPDDQPPRSQEVSPDHSHAMLRRIEQMALFAKEPINKIVGSSRLNPLYYSDTIGFFLLLVVIITGIYILMFFQYGYQVSYGSVESMERFFVSRAARAIHRYASGGLIIFGVLHAIRMLFMDRFQGARWLAWVAGVVTMLIFWGAGVTGYWLIWDTGAQLITQSLLNVLSLTPGLATAFYFQFLDPAIADDNGWQLMLLIAAAHVGLTIIAGLFYWLHIKRLKRPRFLPPVYWMTGMGALLLIAGLFFPAGMLPPADFSLLPGTTPLDPIFLFYLPPALRSSSWAVWTIVGIVGVTAIAAAVPWLYPRRKTEPIAITPERCTGCQHCVYDCPYGALRMVDRDDDTPFTQLAVLDEKLCVSCGICVGSCDTLAISLGQYQPEQLWQDIVSRMSAAKQAAGQTPGPIVESATPIKVVFTCERHAAHGAYTYAQAQEPDSVPNAAGEYDRGDNETTDTIVEVIPVTCVAMVNPSLMTHTLDTGATEVQIVGCPPNDCTNREGNVWTEERLHRTRAPRLKPSFQDAPIFTTWLSPDHFIDALPLHATPRQTDNNGQNQDDSSPGEQQQQPTTLQQVVQMFNRRSLILALILLAVGLLVQVQFTYTPFSPYQDNQAFVQVTVRRPEATGPLTLEVNGNTLLTTPQNNIMEQVPVKPGENHIRLLQDQATILFEQTVTLQEGERFTVAIDEPSN